MNAVTSITFILVFIATVNNVIIAGSVPLSYIAAANNVAILPASVPVLQKIHDDGSYKPELRAVPLASSPYGLTPAGSGLEGAYVPDINEKLHDDGSYRPELRGVPLAPSPYGLTPAGSGLEGAYVHDLSEKLLYDDGSYKPELYHN